jgi:cytochrome c-type biogenesis protein CcsB
MIGFIYLLLWGAMLTYLLSTRSGKPRLGKAATCLALLAWVVLSTVLVHRGLIGGHWPLTNRFEFAHCYLWGLLAVYLLMEISWRERRAGPFAMIVALLIATYLVTRPSGERGISPLLPALRSEWLPIHGVSATIGYAALSLSAALGLMRLLQRMPSAKTRVRPWLPSVEEIERNMERLIALGFPWLTLSILTGAIWAQQAWGRYWGWDPKETWSLITWLWFLLILHLRTLCKWRGRRLAWLTVVGFGVILFAFLGLPWLVRHIRLESLHTF